MPKPKKVKTTSQLKKELDTIFSEYIRRKYSDDSGYVKCITCGVQKHWKEMQASHFISRSHLSLRFDFRNVFPACVGCNVFKNGNIPSYAVFLEKKFGHGIIQELEKEGRKITKDFPYQKYIKEIKEKLAKLNTVENSITNNFKE